MSKTDLKNIDIRLWAKRFAVYCLGLFIMALGVVFSSKSSLGVSPVTCLANVLYQIALDMGHTKTGLGFWTTASYCFYIVVELVILRRDFKPAMLLQIAASFFFGFFVSLAGKLLAFIPAPETYALRMVSLLISVPLVAFGVMLYLAPQILPTPGDGMSLAISIKTGLRVPSAKSILDCCLAVLSAAVSLIYFRRLVGVREGTVICALTVGFVMKLFMRFCEEPLMRIVGRDTVKQRVMGSEDYLDDTLGAKKLFITVSWESGSDGFEIAKRLAKKLGIKFYANDELIPLEAAESGLSEEYITKHEQNMMHSLAYDFITSGYALSMELAPLEQLFAAQVKVQRRIAATEDAAIIVGRCSDYILYNDPNCFRVFIHAPTKDRVRKLAASSKLSEKMAEQSLLAADASRSRYYEHFTGRPWGDTKYYNLAVDTNTFGLEGSLSLIEDAVSRWQANREAEANG